MKPYRVFAILAVTGVLCGCGSIVTSHKETALPDASNPLTCMRYYLPRGKVQVSAAWNILIPGWEPKITPLIEADPTACYEVDRKVNVLFDDDITLSVDPMTGLLQSASASSTDESMTAVANLAAGAEAAMTFGANVGVLPSATAGRGNLSPEELAAQEKQEEADYEDATNHAFSSSFSLMVDPHQPTQVYYLVEPDSALAKTGGENTGPNSSNHRLYAKFVIELKRINQLEPQPGGNGPANGNHGNYDGIMVRTSIPHQVTVSATLYKEGRHPISQKQQPTTQIVFLPDDFHDYCLPLARIPLVTTSTKVTLVNGMVQSLQRNRPSMVNAVAGVPKNILSALVPLPLAIHQNNVQVNTPQQSTPAKAPAPAKKSAAE